MQFTLLPLTDSQLECLAASVEPAELQAGSDPGSMPPAFVAARTMRMRGEGAPVPWSQSFFIVRSHDARIVGACGFKTTPRDGRVEVGYGVSAASRGQGAATMALTRLLEMAFDAGATEVLAEVLPENAASIRVVRKAGFEPAGERVDDDGDFVIQWIRRLGV